MCVGACFWAGRDGGEGGDAVEFEGGDNGSVDLVPKHVPGAGSAPKARLLLGIGDVAFHQEVLDYLGRDARVEIVGSTFAADALMGATAERRADAVVLCPTI